MERQRSEISQLRRTDTVQRRGDDEFFVTGADARH